MKTPIPDTTPSEQDALPGQTRPIGSEPSRGTIIDDWRVLRVLSSDGAMACIYEVEHAVRKETAALKLLRPKFAGSDIAIQRSELEAIAGTRVQHPTINPVLATGHYAGRPYLVAPLLRGKNLRGWIRELGAFSIPDALSVAIQVSAGLAALHEQARAVHRDVKPDNIFITYDGAIKLLDLGFAKFLETLLSQKPRVRTSAADFAGTVAYLAPEQQTPGTDVTFRSDLFSLGLVLYEMMAGRHPHLDKNGKWPSEQVLLERLKHNELPPLLDQVVTQCPTSLAHLVAKCLAPSPADRPDSAAALRLLLVDELDRWLYAHPSTRWSSGALFRVRTPSAPRPSVSSLPVPTADPPQQRPHRARRQYVLWLAIGIALVVSIFAARTRWRRATRPSPSSTGSESITGR